LAFSTISTLSSDELRLQGLLSVLRVGMMNPSTIQYYSCSFSAYIITRRVAH